MDYEKAYKHALDLAKQVHDTTISKQQKENIEIIFPELRESEDERVRKRIIALVNAHGQGRFKESMLAWLEKLKVFAEQKPIDKIQLGKKYKCIASPRYSTFMIGEIYKPEDKFLCSLMNFCYDCFEPIEDGEQKPNPYSGTSFEYNGHTWGMCARDNGVDILLDKQLFKHLEKQGELKSAWSEDYTERMGQIINYLTCQAKEELTRKRTLLGWVALLKSIFRKGLPEIQIPCTEAARKGIHRIMDVLDWAADKGRISDSDCEDYMILLSAYLPQPKIEWSKEDERGWTNTMIMIKDAASNHYTKDSIKLVTTWLESIKQRIGG